MEPKKRCPMPRFAKGLPALLLLLTIAACAPRVAEMGPRVQEAQLLADRAVMADGTELPVRAWLPVPPVTLVLAASMLLVARARLIR